MRSLKNISVRAIMAASLVAMPGASLAQDNTVIGNTVANSALPTDTVDPALNGEFATTQADPLANDNAPVRVREEEDNDFPWGLLGLLGLAGLLGRKKKNDIHVDARDDRRNV
jgi:LPXTG-motif cell wall-anchored protein